VEAVPATAGSYVNQTCKPDAVLKRAAARASVDLSEIEICKQHVAPVRIGLIPQTPAVLQASVDLSKTPISKRIAEQQAEGVVANAALSASQICKPCATQRQAVDLANVDLFETAICRRLVGRSPNNIEEPFFYFCFDGYRFNYWINDQQGGSSFEPEVVDSYMPYSTHPLPCELTQLERLGY